VIHIQGETAEIHELAGYEVRPEALDQCLAAIHEFVAYVRANEVGALRYEVWQETEHPSRFVHIFVWKDAEANRVHGDRLQSRSSPAFSIRTALRRWSSLRTDRSTRMRYSGASRAFVAPPNPRLQRTPLRAPLRRKPIGLAPWSAMEGNDARWGA
jgi:quinol monooxygenase YgiN